MNSSDPIDVFIGYAQADTRFLEQLRKQLTAAERIGLVDAWHDGEIEAGSNREEAIRKAMDESEIILLLISADFIASEFNYEKEMKWAMALHEQKKATVLPVILKDCTWKYAPFAHLKVLPRGGIPVTDEHWKTTDRAFKQVVEEVIKTSNLLRGEPVEAALSTQDPDPDPASGTSKKGGILSLKNGFIALFTILALIFAGNWIIGDGKEKNPVEDSNLTMNPPSTDGKQTGEKEINGQTNPPPKKQDQPKTPTDEKAVNTVEEKTARQPDTYDNPSERINTSDKTSTTEKTNTPEILPEPEPQQPEPQQYLINGEMMTDQRDKKSYRLTKINGAWWMAENLNTNVANAFCPENCAKAGRLYDYKTALQLCPKGWRLPTKAEWKALTKPQITNLKLASTLSGTKYRQQYLQAGQKGYYWTSERSSGDEAWAFEISSSGNYAVDRRYNFQGMHCRCVIDE